MANDNLARKYFWMLDKIFSNRSSNWKLNFIQKYCHHFVTFFFLIFQLKCYSIVDTKWIGSVLHIWWLIIWHCALVIAIHVHIQIEFSVGKFGRANFILIIWLNFSFRPAAPIQWRKLIWMFCFYPTMNSQNSVHCKSIIIYSITFIHTHD